jgi:hypothetical protein
MKHRLLNSLLFASVGLLSIGAPAFAEQVCIVSDPTGTPLNVRNSRNGEVIMTLSNGTEVRIDRRVGSSDDGRWVYIFESSGGQYRALGWVYREFISCYDR